MKTCTKCGERKALDEFYKHSGTRDDLKPSCKSCHRAYAQSATAKAMKNARRRQLRELDSASAPKPRHGNYKTKKPGHGNYKTKHNPWGRRLTEDEKEYWREQFANAGNRAINQGGTE